MRRHRNFLILSLVAVLFPLVAVVASGATPQLGLDLQGGLSVVLAPKEKAASDALDQAVDIIRNRVDSLGVAEPEVSRQGENIIVELPGVEQREDARKLVGQTAELRFRPVLRLIPGDSTTTTAPAVSSTTAAPSTTAVPSTTAGAGSAQGPSSSGPGTTTSSSSSTTTSSTTTSPAAGGSAGSGTAQKDEPVNDDPEATVTLPLVRSEDRIEVGPSELSGEVIRTARHSFDSGEWKVNITFTRDGSKRWDEMAARYVQRQIAIELDGVVQSYPTILVAKFEGRAEISGGFKEQEVKDLALVLRYGALPVELEELTVEDVSPTLGRDQLRSGIVAGIFGLALVMVYMLFYYRLLGLVILAGLLLVAGAVYALTAWLGQVAGLTLTLAGVTGLIVSVGVTVDSYVVYFERLKDEVRSGKTIRSSLDKGFARSFRTIVAADTVALIGSALLYLLAVGSVRGFAFFLGLSTILDLLVSYFFMHPLVSIVGRNPTLARAGKLGVAAGLDAGEPTT